MRCFRDCSHHHLVGIVSHSKQQSSSRDDIVGDNSNQEQLEDCTPEGEEKVRSLAPNFFKRKLGVNVLVEP